MATDPTRLSRNKIVGLFRQYREVRDIMEGYVHSRADGLTGIDKSDDHMARMYRSYEHKSDELVTQIEQELSKP